MGVIVDAVLYAAVVLHRAPVMDRWKVSVLPFSVVVDEGWNGRCLRNEEFVSSPN